MIGLNLAPSLLQLSLQLVVSGLIQDLLKFLIKFHHPHTAAVSFAVESPVQVRCLRLLMEFDERYRCLVMELDQEQEIGKGFRF
jgi:hypothetical protein